MANPADTVRADHTPGEGLSLDRLRASLVDTRSSLALETILVAVYFLLRTTGFDGLLLVWLPFAMATAVIAPTSGLVILAVIAPFEDAFVVGTPIRSLGLKPFILGALALGIVGRVVLDRGTRMRLSWPLILAAIVLVGSGAGLLVSFYRFGPGFTVRAAHAWANGIASAIVVLGCAAWVARNGETRPLFAAIGTTVAVAILSLVSYFVPEAFRSSPLGWMAIAPAGHRLVELARSPTSAAAVAMIPATFLLAAVVLAPDRRIKVIAALAVIPPIVVGYLTYTRTVYVALWAAAVIVAWRVRRAAGIAILVGGIALAVILLPSYIRMRGDLLGGVATPTAGQQLIASDAQRITAWQTSIRMTIDSPLIGQGYRAYRQVGQQFGADAEINAPHNEWLRLFAENGVAIGVAGLAFVVTSYVALQRRRDWLGTAILASYVSIVLAACFNNPFLYNQVMIPAFIVTGTGLGLAEQARRTTDGSSRSEPVPRS